MIPRILTLAVVLKTSTYALDSDIFDYLEDVYVKNPKPATSCGDSFICDKFEDIDSECHKDELQAFCPVSCKSCVAKPEGHEFKLLVREQCSGDIFLEHSLVWSDACQPDPRDPKSYSWKVSCLGDFLHINFYSTFNCKGVPASSDIEDGKCEDGVKVDIERNLCASQGDTFAPSSMPSRAPTSKPTETDMPTGAPSETPTFRPSNYPSTYPTPAPSDNPSIEPTPEPTTLCPSLSPSFMPTPYPSRVPSTPPTRSPTDPTTRPTLSPSVSPTPPTSAPTSYPTTQPTKPEAYPGAKKTGDGAEIVEKGDEIVHILIIAPLGILLACCCVFVIYCICMSSGDDGSQRSTSDPNKDLELANAESAATAATAESGKAGDEESDDNPRMPSLVGGPSDVPEVDEVTHVM